MRRILSEVIELPMGKAWDKYVRELAIKDKQSLFKLYKSYEESKNGLKRESLPKP